jgi:hypothetical protein
MNERPSTFNGNLAELPAALQPLTKHRRWVLWKWELNKQGKWTKVPYRATYPNKKASSSDPETWSTYEAALATAERADGIGYMLSEAEGVSNGIGAIDLDKCRNPATGRIADWAQKIVDESNSYAEVTVSGTGLRVIGTAQGTELHTDIVLPEGGGIEWYRRATRYITISGQQLCFGAKLSNIDELIDRTYATYESAKPKDKPKAKRPEAHHGWGDPLNRLALANLDAWVPDLFPSAHKTADGGYRIKSDALGRDLEEDLSISPKGIKDWGVRDQGDPRQGKRTAVELVVEYGKTREWLEEKLGYGPSPLEELNSQYAIVTVGSNVRVMALQENPPVYYRVGDFNVLLLNRRIDTGDGKTMPLSAWWLAHPKRRQYRGVVFEPGEPETVRGCRNLWTGFTVEPIEGDCSLYLALLKDVICSGDQAHYDYLLNVMADTVQNPNKQGEVCIVMRGKEGVGKGFAAGRFGHLFGRHFLPITQSTQVTGKFNGHLAHCSVLFGDEAFFAGDKQHESVLKALITEPSFMIERKGVDAVSGRNLTHLWLSSNEDWVVPAGATARRFFCLDVSETRRNDTAYFGAIDKQMREGGYSALLHFLLNRDLSKVDIRKVPETKALATQKALTRRGIDALIEWLCDMGTLPCARNSNPATAITSDPHYDKDLFYAVAKKQISGLQYMTPTAITRTLKKEWECKSWCSDSKRGIEFPKLARLRELFVEKHGSTDWSSEGTEWQPPGHWKDDSTL